MKAQKAPLAGQKSISSFFKPAQAKAPTATEPKAPTKPSTPTKGKAHPPKMFLAENKVPEAPAAPANDAPQPAGGKGAVAQNADEATGSQPKGEKAVGRRISVYWPLEKDWFCGRIKRYSDEKGKYFVEYDDGDHEWLRLTKEKYKLLPEEAPSKPKAGRNAVLMSDSDGESEEGQDDANDSGSDWAEDEKAAMTSDNDDEESEEEDEEIEEEEGEEESPMPAAKKRKKPATTGSLKPPAPKKQSAAGRKSEVPRANAAGLLQGTPPQPSAHAKKAMKSAFDIGAPPPTGDSGAAAKGLSGEAVRFASRDAERFQHLVPENLRDAKRRRPGEPGYDPRTLYIPPSWFKDWKVSEGQKQWWNFKAANFDSVLMFKMGKFYEMFEMDAHVGAEVLGLSYMKGDQPHCGFPEKNYHQNAELLARAGHRVVVIEQTETPDMLAQRNKDRAQRGEKKATVVNRAQVAVLTRATLMDPEMLASNPEASYLLAIMEMPNNSNNENRLPVRIGFVVTDCPTGEVMIGQWADDELRSRLRAHLTAFKPVEVVMLEGGVSAESQQCMRGCLRNPRVTHLRDASVWEGSDAMAKMQERVYFQSWPGTLKALQEAGELGEVALGALGGLVAYLADMQLDRAILPLGKLQLLPESDCCGGKGSAAAADPALDGEDDGPEFMGLDGAALENLEVLENTEGGAEGTLIAALDNCATAAGRRLLRQWLLRPLGRVAAIEERQEAVADLMSTAAEAAGEARRLMSGMADLERGLARLQSVSFGASSGRDAANVVLYEDQGKRRVASMVTVIQGLKALKDAAECFDGVRSKLNSRLLLRLVTPGEGFPDMAAALKELEEATDWQEAMENGQIVPAHEGVSSEYDEAQRLQKEASQALQAYLSEVKKEVSSSISFTSSHKETHLLEIPEAKANKVPREWELRGQRKGFRCYSNTDLQELVVEHKRAQESMERSAAGILTGLIGRFNECSNLWAAAVSAASQLDALASLAHAAATSATPVCRPKFVVASGGNKPFFEAKGICHPAGLSGRHGCFVPNDVTLGGREPPFLLLTGPNMGGKSTLLRQVALATVMAQVGAWVPAESLSLSPIDAIYVRMGARDHIMSGQSTFMVELSETATMLRRATARSLVVLDELGRGTATSDGAAIAAAVLSHMVSEVGCLGMFATHYHRLAEDHRSDPLVSICHMGAKITPGVSSGDPDEVCFLYKLTKGACPKSYGHNVARLAGLPASVVAQAAVKAAELEALFRQRANERLGQVPEEEDKEGDACMVDVEALSALQGALEATQQGSSSRLMAAWKQARIAAATK